MNIRKFLPTITLMILLSALFFAGCDTLVTEQITEIVVGNPDADFGIESGSSDSGCAPLTVVFADLTVGPKDRYIWTYGDGNVDTIFDSVSSPTHVYDTAGTFDVSLQIRDSETGGDDFEFIKRFIIVGQALVGFTADTSTGCIGTEVTFTKDGFGDTAWAWDFGDGLVSTEENPTHTYNQVGVFTVSLTAQGACGSDNHTVDSMITIWNCPTATMMVVGDSSCVGATVTFNDTTQVDSTQVIVARVWDFGDGTSSVEQNTTHDYDTAGVFDVTLKVTTDDGGFGIDSSIVTIFDSLAAKFDMLPIGLGCLSNFQQFKVKFENQSDGNIDSVKWNFGDGYISTESNPVHAYTTPGYFTVQLAVSGLCDGVITWDTTSMDSAIIVTDSLSKETLAFSITPPTGDSTQTYLFTDLSTGVLTGWSWDFGDGNTIDTGSVVDHKYTFDSTFTVTLTLTNNCGDTTIIDSVKVETAP